MNSFRWKSSYTPYPSVTKETKDKWAVIKTKTRGVFEVTEAKMETYEIFQVEQRFESPLTVTRVERLCLASITNMYDQTSNDKNEGFGEEDKDFEDTDDENELFYLDY